MKPKKEVKTNKIQELIEKKENRIKEMIDRFGELKEKEKEIKNELDTLKEDILNMFKMEDIDFANGEKYTCKVIRSLRMSLIPSKVLKYVGNKHLNTLFTVKIDEAKKYLTPEQIEKCIQEEKEVYSLTVKRLD